MWNLKFTMAADKEFQDFAEKTSRPTVEKPEIVVAGNF
jgi:hypothetical protein